MNEHAGPACALSGLIVAIFAILLHDKTPPPSPSPTPTLPALAPKPVAREIPAAPATAQVAPATAVPAGIPSAREGSGPASRPPAGVGRALVAGASVALRQPPRVDPPPAPGPVPAPTKGSEGAPAGAGTGRPPLASRPSFTVVGEGETLADVAARIYGSREAREALWKANRDQVERVDSPLPRGTLLRTP